MRFPSKVAVAPPTKIQFVPSASSNAQADLMGDSVPRAGNDSVRFSLKPVLSLSGLVSHITA